MYCLIVIFYRVMFFFFFNDTATTEIYTLSLHDALPILQSPESHAFRITHDYTVRRVGEKYYFNVVRAGSHVTNPESIDLDRGEKLKWEIISGKQAVERKLPINDPIKDDSEIVVTHLARALEPGTTNRIRLMETYADPKSYYLDGDELVWDRSFGRLRNTVVLPPGWYLTGLASPATIQTLPDGRVSIYVVNPRNDDVRVYFRARRRPPGRRTNSTPI